MDILEICCSGGTAKALSGVPEGMEGRHWLRGVFYEAPFLEYLRSTYHGGVWVDGGSALGNHTLFMAKFCDCKRVVSIDPIASSLKIQRQILEMNGVASKVDICPYALAATCGPVTLHKFGPGVGHWQVQPGSELSVGAVTLDSLNLRGVKVLKLDVEYSELAALQGARALLKAQHPAIFTECNMQQELDAIGKYLQQFGYGHGKSWHTMHEWIAK